ncbi:MAG: metallophosphoesterase [Clostridia bacterium]|nr:metallophosphoesterase [Clostridia bacterium]
MIKNIAENLKTHPAVFAVGHDYQIMVPVKASCIMFAEIGGERFYDSANGINRSETPVHRMIVPMKKLDNAGKYTLGYRKIINRKPYFPELEDEVLAEYDFKPVRGGRINIYHIADAHNEIVSPVRAGKHFGSELDLLVLNGDIPNHSGTVENFDTVYEIVSQITEGSIPCVFSRGNHDLRGLCAEAFAEYTPSAKGSSFYTIRIGKIWAILLDCGEDKPDTNEEYGGTVDCHRFRLSETEFLKKVIENADNEYEAEGVEYKLVISHVPFARKSVPPFDIEEEIFTEWCKLLSEKVKPHLMLSGHLHQCFVSYPGDEYDSFGQPCPLIVGSKPFRRENKEMGFIGCAISLENGVAEVKFNSDSGEIYGSKSIEL